MRQNMIERMAPAQQRFIVAMRAANKRFEEVAKLARNARANAITRAQKHRKVGVPALKDTAYNNAVKVAEEEYQRATHGMRSTRGRIFNESMKEYFEVHDRVWAGYIMNEEDKSDTAGL